MDVPELTALQERARLRAAARAGGADRLRGHIVCDGLVRIFKAEGVEVVALQGLDLTGANPSGRAPQASWPMCSQRNGERPGGHA